MTDSTHAQMPKERQAELEARRNQTNLPREGFDPDLGVTVLERDAPSERFPNGFARVTESIPGVTPEVARSFAAHSRDARLPDTFIDEEHPHASQKLPDNLADQVPTGKDADGGKLNRDSAMTGQKLATSADNVQQPLNPVNQPRSFPVSPSVRPAAVATSTPVAETATTAAEIKK